jgi:hypothetical protein
MHTTAEIPIVTSLRIASPPSSYAVEPAVSLK